MKKALFIVALLMLLAVQPAVAQQYKYEVGPSLGMTGYLGEANSGNVFKHPSFTVGGIFRYNHNSRWAFKANLNYANIRGNSKDDLTQYPDGIDYDFNSSLIDAGFTAQMEKELDEVEDASRKWKIWQTITSLPIFQQRSLMLFGTR